MVSVRCKKQRFGEGAFIINVHSQAVAMGIRE
jgi:hypothetical protein